MSFRLSKRTWLKVLVGLVIAFPVIQLIPYGHNHRNPPVVREPDWNSPQTRKLAEMACFDCHSNQTVWPWYSNVAPVSWLVLSDVQDGRRHLNFSEWGQGRREEQSAKKIREVISEGDMPPIQYLLMHPLARLSQEQKRDLIDGLTATVGSAKGEREN